MDFEPLSVGEFFQLAHPQKYCEPHDLKQCLSEFMQLNCYAARVLIEPGEYRNMASLRSALSTAVYRYYKHSIQVFLMKNEVYLVNMDYKEGEQ